MSFIQFIKNPSEYIWRNHNFQNTHPIQTTNKDLINNQENTDIKSPILQKRDTLSKAVTNKDWVWLFRGKTGTFIKISIPLIIILLIISGVVSKPKTQVVEPPKPIDQGDTLQTPDFESVGYTNASKLGRNFIIFSPILKQANTFGETGVMLSSTPYKQYSFYYPLDEDNYVFFEDNTLKLHYHNEYYVREYGEDVLKIEEDDVPMVSDISDIVLIQNLHKTEEGQIAFTYQNNFYVFGSLGKLVDQYEILDPQNTYLYTYYAGEIYYIKRTGDVSSQVSSATKVSGSIIKYSLEKMNNNKEVIYSQDLGENKVQNMFILNDDRFLIVFEEPSDKSFFFVQMRDSDKRTVFGFTPDEEVQKLVKINNLYFTSENNTVLMVGGGIAKLFTSTGKQLWIN